MTTPSHRPTSSSLSFITSLFTFPPKSPNLNQNLLTKRPNLPSPMKILRRDAALLSFLSLVSSFSHPAPASAFGISGPKDWLKEQKKKSSKFLLAPIDASREILRSAYLILTASESGYTNKELEEVQELLRSAARDCVPQDRNSFVAFQASTGVEVCTFQLIVKNAASLLGKKDSVKLEADAMLNDLIRSFTSLNGLANESDIQVASDRKKLADALTNTLSSLNKFEQGVKDCLEV
ncbi:uncharacterized protein LOC126664339 [Mercurialis annua]|uniref:uncharacterized protein LOC126664339 n=1 Tax=Mercurialis annua TaxID=3986 RepID=UPI00215EDD57|nr:uncharacterized protein LOC126664339 [Mercurialis annua]XP_050212649.1 uncharacterized protein LOC126664339 [Mercurialis annua]